MKKFLMFAAAWLAVGAFSFTVLGGRSPDTPTTPQMKQAAMAEPAPTGSWIVVLVSWDLRKPMDDQRFKTYEDCKFYMVNFVLPVITNNQNMYAKCEKQS